MHDAASPPASPIALRCPALVTDHHLQPSPHCRLTLSCTSARLFYIRLLRHSPHSRWTSQWSPWKVYSWQSTSFRYHFRQMLQSPDYAPQQWWTWMITTRINGFSRMSTLTQPSSVSYQCCGLDERRRGGKGSKESSMSNVERGSDLVSSSHRSLE